MQKNAATLERIRKGDDQIPISDQPLGYNIFQFFSLEAENQVLSKKPRDEKGHRIKLKKGMLFL